MIVSYNNATKLNWKNKWYNHKLCFNNRKLAYNTALSKYVRRITDESRKSPIIECDIV